VREGAVTGRDVLGSADGERVANVNTRVGQGNLRGTGDGATLGGGYDPDCNARPEVQAYLAQVKQRTLARWYSPPNTPLGRYPVTLQFQLDVAGSTRGVQLVQASNSQVGTTAADALRSAAPFQPLSDKVRCLSEAPIKATFLFTVEKG
jgi:hypothetical protein